MNIISLQLLPQSPSTQLPTHLKFSKVLHFVKFFTQLTIETLEFFYINNFLNEFDPHVGETSCQTRAYQILLINNKIKKSDIHSINRKLDSLMKLVERIENDMPYYEKIDTTRQKNKCNHTTLEKFISDNKYYFELDKVEFFLIQTRLLTKYKTYCADSIPGIDYDSLMIDLGVSKHTARQLVHNYQIDLSKSSCDFIAELLSQMRGLLPVSQAELIALKNYDDDGRHVLPCYWTMKIMYTHMLYTGKAILVSIKRQINSKNLDKILLFFTISARDGIKYLCNISDLTDHPCFVINGIAQYSRGAVETKADYIKRFLSMGLEKIIFSNMAAHPQYSGKKLNTISTNLLGSEAISNAGLSVEFMKDKNQAEMAGCTINNPSLFYIEHILGGRLYEYMILPAIESEKSTHTSRSLINATYKDIVNYA